MRMTEHANFLTNRLLARAPGPERDLLLSLLQLRLFETREVLYERFRPIDFVYFPLRGCVSLIVDFSDGFQIESGLVGSEGFVGVPVLHGSKTDVVTAVAQMPTEALGAPAGQFSRLLDRLPTLHSMLRRYGEGLRQQAMQLAACNGRHGIQARLARCILTLQDRSRGNDLPVTHELLASLLCVHRPTISVAARRLQNAGLIVYTAGVVCIADRVGLEAVACECYGIVRDQVNLPTGPV